ncbi:hypothetical protein AB4Z38_11795 [Arthrobacter sp. 2RAF6]|uniref:hypothetical protein n=1 Tax=Arthrobacter sp. 2RAF6 TaxID=3233002 RepID=UPI003F8F33A6
MIQPRALQADLGRYFTDSGTISSQKAGAYQLRRIDDVRPTGSPAVGRGLSAGMSPMLRIGRASPNST